MTRPDGRAADELRPVRFTRGWLDHAEGSVLVEFGKTRVLCAASVTEEVPRWRRGSGLGWGTAEYAMLPRATNPRKDRGRGTGHRRVRGGCRPSRRAAQARKAEGQPARRLGRRRLGRDRQRRAAARPVLR